MLRVGLWIGFVKVRDTVRIRVRVGVTRFARSRYRLDFALF